MSVDAFEALNIARQCHVKDFVFVTKFYANHRMQSGFGSQFYKVDAARGGIDVGERHRCVTKLQQAVDQFLRRKGSVAQAKPGVAIEQQDELNGIKTM